MSNVKILSKGLAIKKPTGINETGLELKFLNDAHPQYPHKLKLVIKEGRDITISSAVEMNITSGTWIKITFEGKHSAIENNSNEAILSYQLVNLNNLHDADLKFRSPIPFKLTKLTIDGALPYSVTNTQNTLFKVKNGVEILRITNKKCTHVIGSEFALADANAKVKIEILNSDGTPLPEPFELRLPKDSDNNIEITLDNDCESCDDNYNDFPLYYEVLDGKDTRIFVKSETHGNDRLACNPVEGGGGG